MNRAETAEAIKVMQAWLDGKEVEWRYPKAEDEEWSPTGDPSRGETQTWSETFEYRIKRAPKVVPWTAETFPKDRPVWVKNKASATGFVQQIHEVSVQGASIVPCHDVTSALLVMSWGGLCSEYEQHDGSPCGTVEDGGADDAA